MFMRYCMIHPITNHVTVTVTVNYYYYKKKLKVKSGGEMLFLSSHGSLCHLFLLNFFFFLHIYYDIEKNIPTID